MGWLKARFGEDSTKAGLSVLFLVLSTVTPQYAQVWQALAGAMGVHLMVKVG